MMLTPRELEWAAGFLEGEGSFVNRKNIPGVVAAQVQREPLDRLQGMFGGKMYLRPSAKVGRQPCYFWALYGIAAAGLSMTMLTLMSSRRRQQILSSLARWRSVRARRGLWKTCKHGHAFAGSNIQLVHLGKEGGLNSQRYVASGIYRRCRECSNSRRRERYASARGDMLGLMLTGIASSRLSDYVARKQSA